MTDFCGETSIKKTRKARPCYGCGRTIDAGSAAIKCFGSVSGDFWAGTYHADCREAEIKLNTYRDYRWGDDFMSLADLELDDWPMLIEEFPAVAERFGITQARYDEAKAEEQRRWDQMRLAKQINADLTVIAWGLLE